MGRCAYVAPAVLRNAAERSVHVVAVIVREDVCLCVRARAARDRKRPQGMAWHGMAWHGMRKERDTERGARVRSAKKSG